MTKPVAGGYRDGRHLNDAHRANRQARLVVQKILIDCRELTADPRLSNLLTQLALVLNHQNDSLTQMCIIRNQELDQHAERPATQP